MAKKKLTKAKAKEILHDGTVHGKPLTEKQRRYFGAMSNAQQGGKFIGYESWGQMYQQGGTLPLKDELQLQIAIQQERRHKRDSVSAALQKQYPNDISQFLKKKQEYYKTEPKEYSTLNVKDLSDTRKKQLLKKYGQSQAINDNMGQWNHPGKVTEIDSNNITMKNVKYPVLGISDIGDSKVMFPENDYTFKGDSVTEFPLAKSGIHIKESKKGTFTKAAKKRGKGVQEFASQVLAHKENYSTAMVKKAVFAKNASKWKKGQSGINLPDEPWYGENLNPPQNNLLESLGGTQGLLNTAGSIIGNIQQIGQDNRDRKKAKQFYKLAKLTNQASSLAPEKVKRKYTRPEDNLVDPNELYSSYGVGSNLLARNGAEIQNIYNPGELYSNLEYEPFRESEMQQGGSLNFFNGINSSQVGNLGQILGSAIGGGGGRASGAGQLGSTLGTVAGTAFGGPIGGAIGSAIGGAIGGVIGGGNQRATRRYERRGNALLQQSTLSQGVQSLRNQYTGFMENGGYVSNDWNPQAITKFGNIDAEDWRKTFLQGMNTLRTGGNIRQNMSDVEMNGELKIFDGGKAEKISYNPYLPEQGESILFKGNSHDNGGIPIAFGNNPVEVEGGEPAVKLQQGGDINSNLVVFGNMKIPSYGVSELNDPKAKGKKFKNYINDLNNIEQRQNKISNKAISIVDSTNPDTPYDRLSISSAEAMLTGTNMKMKELAQKKQTAASIQNAILETAEEHNLDSDALSRGKIKKLKTDKKIAQSGSSIPTITSKDVDQYLTQGYEYDPSNKFRLRKQTITPGSYDYIPANPPKKGGEEFNKAFGKARKQGLEQFEYKGKKYTTDLYNEKKKGIQKPSGEKWDYVDIRDPFEVGKIPSLGQIPINARITPISIPNSIDTPVSERTSNKFGALDVINSILPYVRPSNQRPLDPNQLSGEMYALASNQLEPVQAQLYYPLLEQVSDVSYQDQLNANQSDFNSLQRLVGNNPTALSALAAQKYAANSSVLGEQFRQNQAQRMGTYNRNRGVLNDATLKNLAILDQQYVRQSQAKSNTKATAQAALNSISDKIAKNKLENRTLGVYENLYNYRFLPNGQAFNLNPAATFQFPSGMNALPTYIDNLVPEGKEAEFNSRGQLKDIGSKAKPKKSFKNGSVVKAMKNY